jgi:hypothetical protein
MQLLLILIVILILISASFLSAEIKIKSLLQKWMKYVLRAIGFDAEAVCFIHLTERGGFSVWAGWFSSDPGAPLPPGQPPYLLLAGKGGCGIQQTN